jgi:cobalt-zinc-cadmium efflux system protein
MPHDHHHHSAPSNNTRAFAIGVALNLAFVAVEFGFGIWSHSVALLADAAHNLSDVLGLALAWAAAYASTVGPNERRTYGFRRTSILAALANALILLVVTGGITWEAVRRLFEPTSVMGTTMIFVGAAGVAVNGLTAWLFYAGRRHDLNIRGAFLHMVADAAVSLGVVVTGALVRWQDWTWVDPIASFVIVAAILYSTWGLLLESINLALDAVPREIDPVLVRDYLKSLSGISDVHDLHIWGMSTTENALTVHLVKPDGQIDDAFLAEVEHTLHDRFGIVHPTIQLEQGDAEHSCKLGTFSPVSPWGGKKATE